MILVDYRESESGKGSKGLWEDLSKTSLPIQLDTLEGGDLMFEGNGPEGKVVTVGIEFKKIRDLLSSLRSERLQGHQLHELQHYDFRFLLVEGEWVADDDGMVLVRGGFKNWTRVPGGWKASELDKTLLGLTLRGGVVVKETHSRKDTVRWIQSVYRNFTDMEWDDHTSHTGIYRPMATLQKPSGFVGFLCGIPGLGLKRAKAVEAFWWNQGSGKASPRAAIAARADTWGRIDGIGSKVAEQIDRFLEGD